MMNDDAEFDVNAYKGVIDEERIFSMWAKIEMSKILMKRANELTAQVESDIQFYSMMNAMQEE